MNGTPTPLFLTGKKSKLADHTQVIGIKPVLDYFAIGKAEDADLRLRTVFPCGRKSHERSGLGAAKGAAYNDFIAFCNDIINCNMLIRKRTRQHFEYKAKAVRSSWKGRWKWMIDDIRCNKIVCRCKVAPVKNFVEHVLDESLVLFYCHEVISFF